MKWIATFLIMTQCAAASLRYLCISQNNNYRLPLNKRAAEYFLLCTVTALPSLLMGVFLPEELLNNLIRILYSLTILLIFFLHYLSYRTKFVFTARGTTLFCVNLGIVILACSLFAVFFNNCFSALSSACVLILLPAFSKLSEWSVNPFFERKNKKFVESNLLKLRESNAIRIGITGSYGKTSCKNILATMLREKFEVQCTEENYNTPMGIALTVKKMTGKEEIFIAEMGARHRGDIGELVELVKPDYSITTGVCAQHLKTFRSLHNIYLEKYKLAQGTKKTCVFNGNDRYTLKMWREYHGGKKIKACCGKVGDIYTDEVEMGTEGSSFCLHIGNLEAECHTKLLGKHNILNITMCAALANELGVEADKIVRAIAKLEPIKHRLEYLYSNGIHILDDSYNSNPIGIKSALETMAYFPGDKVVLSQGVVEIGKKEKEFNRNIGRELSKYADTVILCGKNAGAIEEGLTQENFSGKTYRFRSLQEAQMNFSHLMKEGDVLLLQNDLPDIY